MKLSPEQIERIEKVLTDFESGIGHRAIVVRYGFRDLHATSSFLSVLRSLGINVHSPKRLSLPPNEMAAFADFLEAKRKEGAT